MVLKKGNPGCPCCDDDCRIEITGWNVILPSGDSAWDLSNPTSITTEDSSGLAVTTNAHPEAKSTHVVIVSVKGNTDGDILRVVIAYDDADNYLFGEIEVGNDCGYLRLFQRDAGSVFQLGDDVPVLDLAPGVSHSVRLCYDGTTLTILLVGKAAYSQDVTASGQRVGVATGAITTLATFTGFQWWIHYDDGGYYGEPNDCPHCNDIPCTVVEDDFDRPDNNDIGCIWSEESGGWEIEDEELKTTGGLVMNLVPHPRDTEAQLVLAKVKGTADGDSFKLLLDSTADGSEYHYAELIVNAAGGTLRVGNSGGILETKSITAVPDTWHTVCVSIVDGFIVATVGTVWVDAETERFGNVYSGLAATVDSVGYFDDFLFSRHKSDDPRCPDCAHLLECPYCENSQLSAFYKLVVTGVTNDDCDECEEEVNGTHILRSYADPPSLGNNFTWVCGARKSFVSPSKPNLCGDTSAGIGIGFKYDKNWWWFNELPEGDDVYWIVGGISGTSQSRWMEPFRIWGKLWPGNVPIKCTELVDFELDMLAMQPDVEDPPGRASCNWDASTWKVTSL